MRSAGVPGTKSSFRRSDIRYMAVYFLFMLSGYHFNYATSIVFIDEAATETMVKSQALKYDLLLFSTRVILHEDLSWDKESGRKN